VGGTAGTASGAGRFWLQDPSFLGQLFIQVLPT
jgi:hypothetical protein